MSAAIWEGPGCFWLMFAAVLELRTLGEHLAKAVSENVHGHDEEGLNFKEDLNCPLEQDMEEITYLF